MSIEVTERKPRKAPVKKAAAAPEGEKTAKAAPKAKAAKAVAVEVTADATKVKQWPSHEEIARLAHRYYQERGSQHGFDAQDWFRAEHELSAAS